MANENDIIPTKVTKVISVKKEIVFFFFTVWKTGFSSIIASVKRVLYFASTM